MELDGRADGKRVVRDDGRGVVVVPDKISPLLTKSPIFSRARSVLARVVCAIL